MQMEDFSQAQRRVLEGQGLAAESRFVDVASVHGQAHVLVTGSGPPVVMINGIGTPAAMWAPLMAQLAGYTIYAIDLPGFGLTATIPDLTDAYRTTAIRFLGEVLDGLALDRPIFIANSLGSLWATWMAIDQPERVAALVHVGCPALLLGTSAPLPMRMLSMPWLGRLMMKLQPPSLRQVESLSKMVRQYPLQPALGRLLLATEQLPGFEQAFLSTLHTLVRLQGSRPEMDLSAEQIERATQPALFVWGEDDPMGSPEVGKRAVAIMADAEIRVVPGGHAPWLGEPGEVAPLVAGFLEKQGAGPSPMP